MAALILVIGNKKYSSWSLRAWIAMAEAGLSFEEVRVPLHTPDTREGILRYNPAGLVPVLLDGDLTVNDTLAILEYLDETHAPGHLLPAGPDRRARVRSACAEMHSGFFNLRERLPMNLARPRGAVSAPAWRIDEATQAEIDRVLSLWDGLLEASRGPFLFGAWSMADCMYLPVVTRLDTYAVDVTARGRVAAYMERMLNLPAFLRWRAAGEAEPETHPPYDR